MNPIGWCDITRNYIRGCSNNCSYCYVRRFNKRTWHKMFDIESDYRINNDIEDGSFYDLYLNMMNFKPVFMYSQFVKPFPKKPQKIFMDSMSDIAYWQEEWMEKVLNKIKEYPQHKFLFLTKIPYPIYHDWIFPENCFLGVTITNNINMIKSCGYYNFISFEPLLTEINTYNIPSVRWIIIGIETGNKKNKIIPKKEWIENIRIFCKKNNIPYFEKDNLRNILNRNLIQQFPKELKNES